MLPVDRCGGAVFLADGAPMGRLLQGLRIGLAHLFGKHFRRGPPPVERGIDDGRGQSLQHQLGKRLLQSEQ